VRPPLGVPVPVVLAAATDATGSTTTWPAFNPLSI
jgi:hypothetical protein